MRLLLLILSLALVTTARADSLDDLANAELKKQKIPGMALAVIHKAKVVKAEGYGFANVEHQVPVKRETVFQSGSVGKQFTAFLAMMLVEEGKLKLDEPVSKYLEGTPETWKKITVRHLLTHTAGVKDMTILINLRKDYSEDDLLPIAFKSPLDFEPGTKWKYSNTGYMTLGILLSKVAGKFYGDLMAEKMFKPLGMKTARIITEADIIPNRAAGYRFVKDEWKNQNWVSPTFNTTADGSLYLTLDDMIAWDAALTARKLLKKESYEAMWTSGKTSDGKETGYGFGWNVAAVNGHKHFGHGGAWQGFTSSIDRYPDDELTVIAFYNCTGARSGGPGSRVSAFAKVVAEQVVPELAEKKNSK